MQALVGRQGAPARTLLPREPSSASAEIRGTLAGPPPRGVLLRSTRLVSCSSTRPRSKGSSHGKQRAGEGGGRQQRKRAQLSKNQKPLELLEPVGTWRLNGVNVPLDKDEGKDSFEMSPAIVAAATSRMKLPPGSLTSEAVAIVKKAFDARKGANFVYNLDVDASRLADRFESRPKELRTVSRLAADQPAVLSALAPPVQPPQEVGRVPKGKERAVVVGSGPAGLFAALSLAKGGVDVVLLERGQPVESRGRDIGALMARKVLNRESNLCYGEGGAGTWSDGKLTTRIGKNTTGVRRVMEALVRYGAPERILMMSKPHLGTDRLVRILRSFREHLIELGVEVRFGARVEDIVVEGGRAAGVEMEGGEVIAADHVVLAVGHSARALFERLQGHGVEIAVKEFALGFRVEHPQTLIDTIKYGGLASMVERGKGKVPVADYSLAAHPTPDHAVYSFCQCPGGQVVCTSTTEDELCVNGMSFSKRASKWANAALVTPVGPEDFRPYEAEHGQLAGMALQQDVERRAARMGVRDLLPPPPLIPDRHLKLPPTSRLSRWPQGGSFTVPVQRVTDFLDGVPSRGELPSSSYRLGVTPGRLDEIYTPAQTDAMRRALVSFDRQLPGFLSDQGLLHGVETRTSSPVRIPRGEGYESVSLPGLYPLGEGAGYAGGIISAALDGLLAGEAMVAAMVSI